MRTNGSPLYPANQLDIELFEKARDVLNRYGRLDKNSVGAAVRTDKGIFIGLDLKSRMTPICAEPGAISAAYSGGAVNLESIVAVCMRGGASNIVAISPCGACRELINFHAPDCRVLFQYEEAWIDVQARELFKYPVIFGLRISRYRHLRAPACSVNVRICPNRARGGGGFRLGWCGRGGLRGCAGSRRL